MPTPWLMIFFFIFISYLSVMLLISHNSFFIKKSKKILNSSPLTFPW